MKYIGKIKSIWKTTIGGWSAFSASIDGIGTVGVAGQSCPIKPGMMVEIDGTLSEHPEYGMQIKAVSIIPHIEKGRAAMLAFLSSGMIKGIGPSLAARIVELFGADTYDVIANTPEKLYTVKGIGKGKAESIVKSFNESQKYAAIYSLFNGNITRNQARKIIEAYGDSAVQKVKSNPYRLIGDIDGFGFKRADEMAMAAGIPKDSESRTRAGITYTLDVASDLGDCFLLRDQLTKSAIDVLVPPPTFYESKRDNNSLIRDIKSGYIPSLPEEIEASAREYAEDRAKFQSLIEAATEKMIEDGSLIDEDGRIYYKKMHDLEISCAEHIREFTKRKPARAVPGAIIEEEIRYIEDAQAITFADAQRQAVACALQNRLSIITGGPGRGKTTIQQAIINAWRRSGNSGVILCAPTGKAAKRMAEATGEKAYTIHKIIALCLDLSGKLLIVDEASMLDLRLAKSLMEVANDAQIVFIGDADQLPPIGPGLFFRDLINSHVVPCVFLRVGFRAKGLIAQNAEAVLAGSTAIGTGEGFDRILSEKEDLPSKIAEVYGDERARFGESEVCILLPMRKYLYGVNAINTLIRDIFNPDGDSIPGCPYRVGDRIIQTVNNYKIEYVDEDGQRGAGVFNGECGNIVGLEDEHYILRFDDGRIAEYSAEDAQELDLAYALTIHKSQGSEYKSVILGCSTAHYYMLNRSLLYTAITRAKNHVVMIGDKLALNRAVTNNEEKHRNTYLTQRIRENAAK